MDKCHSCRLRYWEFTYTDGKITEHISTDGCKLREMYFSPKNEVKIITCSHYEGS